MSWIIIRLNIIQNFLQLSSPRKRPHKLAPLSVDPEESESIAAPVHSYLPSPAPQEASQPPRLVGRVTGPDGRAASTIFTFEETNHQKGRRLWADLMDGVQEDEKGCCAIL